jgi:cyclophilin family peptidyl-prolyl cis-trans isomerase
MNSREIIALLSITFILFSALLPTSDAEAGKKGNPRILVETSMGSFTIMLYPGKAPITVKNFLAYVDSKFYDETLIHRVEKDFVLQGGGYNVDNQKKYTREPIKNEADNGLKNLEYTLSMARTQKINSATSQFFINLKNNTASLDHRSAKSAEFGYAVFGKVVDGTNVIQKIRNVKTKKDGVMQVPVKPVIIKSMRRIEEKEKIEEKNKEKE